MSLYFIYLLAKGWNSRQASPNSPSGRTQPQQWLYVLRPGIYLVRMGMGLLTLFAQVAKILMPQAGPVGMAWAV